MDSERGEMFRNANFLSRLVASSVAISKKAGQIIYATLGSNLEIIQKSSASDLQTIADRRSQQCIISSLRKQFGNDLTIIGEEDDEDLPKSTPELIEDGFDSKALQQAQNAVFEDVINIDKKDVVVWVDPLDGTSEFTEGLLDHVTVLIGIALNGSPIAGVIHQPFFGYDNKSIDPAHWGRTMWAITGLGAFGVDAKLPPKGQRIITTTRSHADKIVTETIDSLKPDKVIKVGGAGHKVILLLEGKAHAYVFASKGCKKWDTCAPEAILAAIGGKLTDLQGNILSYKADVEKSNSGGVLATAPSVEHQWFVNNIPNKVKNLF